MAKITLVFEHRTDDFLINIQRNYDDFFHGLKPDEIIVATDKDITTIRVKYK